MKELWKYQNNIQKALNSSSMKAFGKLTNLLNNAHQCGLIDTEQLEELDANLEQLRLGNNIVVKFTSKCPKEDLATLADQQEEFKYQQ